MVVCQVFGGASRVMIRRPERCRIVLLILAMLALLPALPTARHAADAQPSRTRVPTQLLGGGAVGKRPAPSTALGRSPRAWLRGGKESRDRATLRRVQV